MFEKLGVNLRSGDIILSVDGVPAQNILKIKNYLKERNAGQVFKVEIQRDGKLVLLEFSE
jgi:S1-C subfamily serine protease